MQSTSDVNLINSILSDYTRTQSLISALQPAWFSIEADGAGLMLHFSNPEGSLHLTIRELTAMNHPTFLAGFYMNRPSKHGILAAIKFQFGKTISKPVPTNTFEIELSNLTSSH